MKPVKLILRNINVLNVLLLAAAVILFFVFDYPLLGGQASVVMQVQAKEATAPMQSEEKGAPESSASYADFISIAEKNMFHPEREMPKAEKAAVPRPELILYGTLITDDVSIAYVEDKKSPYSSPGRGKRQTALRIGGSIGGYVLREIEANRIVLVRGEDKLVVRLDDDTEKRKGTEAAGASQTPKGTSGAFPLTSIVPTAAPAFTASSAAAPPPRPVTSPTLAAPVGRGQTPEAIRNSIMQQRAAPQ